MAFPATPLAVTVKLRISGSLIDVTSDVLGMEEGNAISVTGYGAADERLQTDPAIITFAFKNWADAAVGRVAGQYSNDNPWSPYFGQLGVGTEFQILVDATVRYHGRIFSWTPTADETSRLLVMQVRAGLGKTQLTQGAAAVISPLRRSTLTAAPVAYWPMEDPTGSTLITSALIGGAPIRPAGPVTFASDFDLPGSDALPVPADGTTIRASIPKFSSAWTAVTGWTFSWVMRIPQLPASEQVFVRWYSTNGPLRRGQVSITAAGTINMLGYDSLNNEIITATPLNIGFGTTDNAFVGLWLTWGVTVEAVGANSLVFAERSRLDHPNLPGAGSGSVSVSSSGGGFAGYPEQPDVIEFPQNISGVGIGHLAVWAETFGNIDVSAAFGWLGDSAIQRIQRLCDQEGVTLTLRSHDVSIVDRSEAMGAQRRATALELLQDAADLDGGILHETRDVLDGITYVTRDYMYNQAPEVALDYSAGHLSDLNATIDNQNIENDVSVTGFDSASTGTGARARLETGALSVQAPPNGVGTYDRGGRSLNMYDGDQASRIANWILGLGTAQQRLRIPDLKLELARSVWSSNATLTDQAVGLDLGSALTLDGLLTARPDLPPDMMALQVRGINEVLSQYQRDLTFNVAPGWPWEVWELETGGSTVVAAVSSGGTSLKLATSAGPEWNTFDTPYFIQASGNAMRVTAMSIDTPAFIAAGTVANGNNASVVPGLPAGMTPDVGQLLIVFAAIRNSGVGTPNTPTGYTNIFASANMAVFGRYYVTGDAAPTVSFTGGVANADTTARILGFSGLSLHTDITPATQLNGSAQNIAYPYIGNRRQNEVTFIFGWKQDDWTSVATLSGMTEAIDNATTTGDDQGIVVDYLIQSFPSTDVLPGSFVVTGGANAISRSGVFSLRPLQTATVTRNINGISTSIAAGTPVKGWRLGVNAL